MEKVEAIANDGKEGSKKSEWVGEGASESDRVRALICKETESPSEQPS